MSSPAESTQELLEGLVTECLERMPEEGAAVVENLCARHPEHAALLRRMVDSLARVGLVEAGTSAVQGTLGRSFGPYRLLERLGAGGMGEVYLAEQQDPARRIALKLLRPGQMLSVRARTRFRREIDAVAQLHHPGICPLLDGGEIDGTPFLAMRYVEGQTLAEWIETARAEQSRDARRRDSRASGSEVAELLVRIERVAAALHYAHELGVVHRDVKPGNILITPEGDPVLLDFGLARQEDPPDDGLTLSGDVVGTPAYMAPEQVAGSKRIDRRVDVYGLAATLYEAVTLQSPYTAPTLADLYQRILSGDLERPSARRHGLPRDLDIVLATALDTDPDRRYRTSQAFAEDLRRVREHQPIAARPSSQLHRLRRWTRRRPALATALVSTFLLLATGLVAALLALSAVEHEQAQTATALERVRVDGLVSASNQLLRTDTTLAFLLARAAYRRDNVAKTRSQLLAAMAAMRQIAFLTGHEGAVHGIDVAPDGSFFVSYSDDATARSWSSEGEPLAVFRHDQPVTFAAVIPAQPPRVLTASLDGTARLWDTGGAAVAEPIRLSTPLVSAAVHPHDSNLVAVGGQDGTVALFRASEGTWTPTPPLEGHAAAVTRLLFSPGGDRLLSCSRDGTGRLWSWRDRSHVVLDGEAGAAMDGDFDPQDGRVAIGFQDGPVGLWDAGGSLLRRLEGHLLPVFDVDFGADGSLLTGSGDGTVCRWDRLGGLVNRFGDHDSGVRRITRLGPDGAFLTAAGDGRLRHFAADGQLRQIFAGHAGFLNDVAVLPGREVAVSASRDGALGMFDLRGRALPVLVHPFGRVEGVVRSTVDELVYTGSRDGTVRGWQRNGELHRLLTLPDTRTINVRDALADGRLLVRAENRLGVLEPVSGAMQWKLDAVWDAAAIPGRNAYASLGIDGVVRIVDADSGATRTVLYAGHQPLVAAGASRPRNLDVSPDGSHVLATFDDGACVVSRVNGGARPAQLAHSGMPWAVFASDDLVATACADGMARLWDWRQPTVIETHDCGHDAVSVAVSPGGLQFCVGLRNGDAVVWERGGRRLCRLRAHRGPIFYQTFLAEDLVVTGSHDGTARIWSFGDASLRSAASNLALRDFTAAELATYRDLLEPAVKTQPTAESR